MEKGRQEAEEREIKKQVSWQEKKMEMNVEKRGKKRIMKEWRRKDCCQLRRNVERSDSQVDVRLRSGYTE